MVAKARVVPRNVLVGSLPQGRCARGLRIARSRLTPALSSSDRAEASSSSDGEVDDEAYRPKSTSWGVFERPRDISREFGGGRNLPLGGEALDEDEVEEKRRKTLALVNEYKRKQLATANSQSTDEVVSQARAGVERGKSLMRLGRFTQAMDEFAAAGKLVSPNSSIGGDCRLQTAICLDR